MAQFANQRGFVEETLGVELAFFRVAKNFRCRHLDRHIALGEGVAAEKDGAGRAFAELFDQLVFAELFDHGLQALAGPGDGSPYLFRRGAANMVAAGQ